MLDNGFGSDSCSKGAGLNKEKPVATKISWKLPTGNAGGMVVSGHILGVSGTNPDGTPYSYPNFIIKGGGLQGIYQAPNGLMQYDYPYMALMAGKSGANWRSYG